MVSSKLTLNKGRGSTWAEICSTMKLALNKGSGLGFVVVVVVLKLTALVKASSLNANDYKN